MNQAITQRNHLLGIADPVNGVREEPIRLLQGLSNNLQFAFNSGPEDSVL